MHKLARKVCDRLAYTARGAAARVVVAARAFEPLESFVICSDPRGGSTWLSEIVAQIPRTARIWEPLNIQAVRRFQDLGFAWRQHIHENADWPEAERALSDALRGRILNGWTVRPGSLTDLATADRLTVKFCRANALLPWLTRRFKFRHKPIHLVRHPLAVVASQLSYGAWDAPYEGFVIPSGPHSELWQEHAEYLSSLSTKAEALTAVWALTNRISLDHPRANADWLTVYYEDLLAEPEREIERIFDVWDEPVPKSAATQARVASATTKTATFEQGVEYQLAKWQRALSDRQIDSMLSVLQYFGIRQYGIELRPQSGR
ncbi:MAG TPA: hypothetical protein EYQ27_18060 [Gemmatimonadetes bacterium]|nr:hypothetical protein [Gemmatimonadota bacterium]